jgi:hypothetical protein
MPLLPAKVLSPLYVAVTVCVPTASVEVLKDAVVTPLLVVTVTGLPVLLASTWNCTVPVGVPPPAAVTFTVAVKVTLCPNTDGVEDEETTVLVPGWLTARASTSPTGAVPFVPARA